MLANDPVGQREVVGGFWQELKDWDSQMAEQSAMLANDPQAAASARRRQEDRENGQMFGNDPRVERSRAVFLAGALPSSSGRSARASTDMLAQAETDRPTTYGRRPDCHTDKDTD